MGNMLIFCLGVLVGLVLALAISGIVQLLNR
jgi:hypothetical protein